MLNTVTRWLRSVQPAMFLPRTRERRTDEEPWEWLAIADALVPSDAMLRCYGMTPRPQPIPFDDLLALVHVQDRERVHHAISRTLASGLRFDVTHRLAATPAVLVRLRGFVALDGPARDVRVRGRCDLVDEAPAESEWIPAFARLRRADGRVRQG